MRWASTWTRLWKDLPKDARDAIMYGRDFKVQVSYRNRWGSHARVFHRFRRRGAHVDAPA